MKNSKQSISVLALGVFGITTIASSLSVVAQDSEHLNVRQPDSSRALAEQVPSHPDLNEQLGDLFDRQQLEEILQIRRQLNLGGVLEEAFTLPGETKPGNRRGMSLEEAFLQSLVEARREDENLTRETPKAPLLQQGSNHSQARLPQPQAALLKASRELDRQVHKLDQMGYYTEADLLREMANQLRVKARSSSSTASP